MFTKNQIDTWIELYSTSLNFSDSGRYAQLELTANRPLLKRDLVEAKVMIDRWDNVTNNWVFHTSKKDELHSLFPEEETPSEIKNALGINNALSILKKYATELNIDVSKLDNLTDDDTSFIFNGTSIKNEFHIWGATVHFTDNISPNTAIGLALDKDGQLMPNDSGKLANSIVVFNVPEVSELK